MVALLILVAIALAAQATLNRQPALAGFALTVAVLLGLAVLADFLKRVVGL